MVEFAALLAASIANWAAAWILSATLATRTAAASAATTTTRACVVPRFSPIHLATSARAAAAAVAAGNKASPSAACAFSHCAAAICDAPAAESVSRANCPAALLDLAVDLLKDDRLFRGVFLRSG